MATQTSTKTPPTAEAAFEQIKEVNESMLEAAKKAAIQSLDTYEKAVDRVIDLERKLGDATKQDWLKTMVEAQAEITKDLTHAYATTVRGILK